jgi:hypothetical protein
MGAPPFAKDGALLIGRSTVDVVLECDWVHRSPLHGLTS